MTGPDYADSFVKRGRIGTNDAPTEHYPEPDRFTVVTFDGVRHLYSEAWWMNDPNGFRIWAEEIWEIGTSRILKGKWIGNCLKLEDQRPDQ